MPICNAAIICGDTRNRLTEQCIRSFYEHTDTARCNLTVLDNATPPQTGELLLNSAMALSEIRNPFELVRVDEMLGGGAVTNRVLKAARIDQGQFLYHTASDFYFKDGWLEALLSNWPVAEAMGVGLLGAYSHPFHLPNGPTTKGVGGFSIQPRMMVAGGSWFTTWEMWDKYGPLNELHHGVWIGSEDTEFNQRLIADGVGRATIVPEMAIHTGRTASNGQPTLGAEYMKDVEGVLIL